VLDGDNVLWGGILSEDSMENIKLGGSGFGRAYQDFQRVVLSLYYNGVILAICSKNDLSDVMTVFRNHNEMIIKEEHIACFQVNWDDKINNIKLIAETLNIGFDSIVFVDDSTIEVEAVRSIFPEVTSIRFDCNSIYKDLSCFKLHSNVNFTDIENRNTTYRTNKLRESLKDQYKSYDDYITALDIRLDIHEAMPIEYNRISELTQRTNKCTNGKRYSVTEIKEKVKSKDFKLYSVLVSDKFSNLGLVGAVGVDGKTLDLFSLSCRSLGRKIEDKMISFIRQHHIITQIDFKLTDKNKNIKAIFTSIIN
jgi:FkbH-like protein